jgi:long-subunit fatty acid transport protein
VYSVIAEQSRTAFTIQGAGARATGSGGAFIAVADDASAVSFNPAGLAQLLRPEVSLTGQSYRRNLSLTGFSSRNPQNPTTQEDSSLDDQRKRPSFFSFTVPWKHAGLNTTVQLSYQRILDFDFAADRSYKARPAGGGAMQNIDQKFDQNGGVDMYSLALGAELSQRILVGAAFNVWRGTWDFNSLSQNITAGAPVFDSTLAQRNQFRGVNANLGLIWRSQYLNLGVVYRTPFTATYTFENYFTQPDPATNLIVTTHGDRTPYQLRWPETLGWGLGVHPHPTLLLTADWSRTPWSDATFKAQGTAYDNRNYFDLAVASVTPNVTTFHTGAEWVTFLGDAVVVPLRAGWFKEPQPIVDARTGEQRVLKGWTAGLGVKYRDVTVDLAYRYSRGRRYASRLNADAPTGGVTSFAYGEDLLEERRLFLSLILQLDTAKVHRALGWLFTGG